MDEDGNYAEAHRDSDSGPKSPGRPSKEEVSRRRRTAIERKARELAVRGPAVYDPKPELSEVVEANPNRYSASFGQTPRFPKPPQHNDADYDAEQGIKLPLAKRIQEKRNGLFPTAPREPRPPKDITPLTYDPDWGTKSSIARSVELSPNKVSRMKLNTPRFIQHLPPHETVLDPDCGIKMSIAKEVENSSMKYTNAFAGTPRHFDIAIPGAEDPFSHHDRADYGYRSSIVRAVKESPMTYDSIMKGTPRPSPRAPPAYDSNYDTQLDDIARRANSTPRRYGVMKSQTARFKDTKPYSVGEHGDLHLDYGRMETLATHAKSSPISYGSAFSSTPRFKEKVPDYTPKFYDIDGGPKRPLAKSLDDSPVTYSVMRSNAPRFPKPQPPNAPDLGSYDASKGPAADMVRSVLDSAVSCSAMKSNVPRFSSHVDNPKVGPATYTPQFPAQLALPDSAFASKSPRTNFVSRRENNQSEGIDVVIDNREWFRKGWTMSKTPREKVAKVGFEPHSKNILEMDRKTWTSKGFAVPHTARFPEDEIVSSARKM